MYRPRRSRIYGRRRPAQVSDSRDAAGEPERFPGGVTWIRCDNLTGLVGLATLDDHLLNVWNAPLPPEVAARDATPEEAVTLREQALLSSIWHAKKRYFSPESSG